MSTSRTFRTVRNSALALALALPIGAVVSAAPASAASMNTWEALAECESGGNWRANTGNGFYGGLQFADGTWDAMGGERFAELAHRANKLEQIRVAEKVLDTQGWGAWPACSNKLGLR
ncbi:MAG: transglycosylase family protein [Sporichthyaceae bacterium]